MLEREALRSGSRRDPEAWRDAAYRYADYRLQNDENTLGPQEDVVEKRRARRRHVAMASPTESGSNRLAENVILLLFLVVSIYVLYKVTIYLLTQS